jgi:hypothetical protein
MGENFQLPRRYHPIKFTKEEIDDLNRLLLFKDIGSIMDNFSKEY